MIKAAVFDMDGVIFDSEKIYRMLEHKTAAKYNLPDERVEHFCELIAGGTKESNRHHFTDIFPEATVDYYEFRDGVMTGVDEYATTNGYELKLGVREIFTFFKKRGIRMALATSTAKDRAVYHLKNHGIYDYFDEFVFGNEVKNGKPEPDIYLTACEKLGVKPEEAIGIEDSINGIKSSSAAGLYTVMVIDLILPTKEIEGKANKICNSLLQLKKELSVYEDLKGYGEPCEDVKKLYFTRHGQTYWNVSNQICGATDIGLTEKGHAQAIELGNRLKQMLDDGECKIDKILYSPLMRAKDTALHIAEATGIEAVAEERLREQNFGRFEGTARNGEEFKIAKKNFIDDFSGGETMLSLNQRIYNLLDEIKEDEENTYLLVAHNGIARAVNSYFHNMTNEDYAAFGIDNCNVL
ncbi:MAG: HAD-IA family hydrolase, partial [Lachnospiraceae bacterium]|nr:HAD-IA family hydrolase [Lachnospiraceae bacterium]